jgi:hypothetical protein
VFDDPGERDVSQDAVRPDTAPKHECTGSREREERVSQQQAENGQRWNGQDQQPGGQRGVPVLIMPRSCSRNSGVSL